MYYENRQLLKENEFNMAFNMGLQSAVFVLEKAERLSPEGRSYLIKLLKKNIAENELVIRFRYNVAGRP
jgi:hypothetical protein